MTTVFVAYASGNDFHSNLVKKACKDASTRDRRVTPWCELDTSGSPIARSVESWVEDALAQKKERSGIPIGFLFLFIGKIA